MSISHTPFLELALIDAANAELSVMRSFCHAHFPCDVSTTVAMRMSRSIVTSIYRIAGEKADGQYIVSNETLLFLSDASSQAEHLSKQFEVRLSDLVDNELAWQVWTS